MSSWLVTSSTSRTDIERPCNSRPFIAALAVQRSAMVTHRNTSHLEIADFSPAAAIDSVSYSTSMHPRGCPRFGPDLCHKNCSRTIFPCSWNSLMTYSHRDEQLSSHCVCFHRAATPHLVLRDLEVQVRYLGNQNGSGPTVAMCGTRTCTLP